MRQSRGGVYGFRSDNVFVWVMPPVKNPDRKLAKAVYVPCNAGFSPGVWAYFANDYLAALIINSENFENIRDLFSTEVLRVINPVANTARMQKDKYNHNGSPIRLGVETKVTQRAVAPCLHIMARKLRLSNTMSQGKFALNAMMVCLREDINKGTGNTLIVDKLLFAYACRKELPDAVVNTTTANGKRARARKEPKVHEKIFNLFDEKVVSEYPENYPAMVRSTRATHLADVKWAAKEAARLTAGVTHLKLEKAVKEGRANMVEEYKFQILQQGAVEHGTGLTHSQLKALAPTVPARRALPGGERAQGDAGAGPSRISGGGNSSMKHSREQEPRPALPHPIGTQKRIRSDEIVEEGDSSDSDTIGDTAGADKNDEADDSEDSEDSEDSKDSQDSKDSEDSDDDPDNTAMHKAKDMAKAQAKAKAKGKAPMTGIHKCEKGKVEKSQTKGKAPATGIQKREALTTGIAKVKEGAAPMTGIQKVERAKAQAKAQIKAKAQAKPWLGKGTEPESDNSDGDDDAGGDSDDDDDDDDAEEEEAKKPQSDNSDDDDDVGGDSDDDDDDAGVERTQTLKAAVARPVRVCAAGPVETPSDSPSDAPVDTPVDTPADASVDASVDAPAETPAEAPEDVSMPYEDGEAQMPDSESSSDSDSDSDSDSESESDEDDK